MESPAESNGKIALKKVCNLSMQFTVNEVLRTLFLFDSYGYISAHKAYP